MVYCGKVLDLIGSDFMIFNIVKKKGASNKILGREKFSCEEPKDLNDLLKMICIYQLSKEGRDPKTVLTDEDISYGESIGKIVFNISYNPNKYQVDKALEVMVQDFLDGLFRVFINGEEYKALDEKLKLQGENEVVFIRFVMMAGRLW